MASGVATIAHRGPDSVGTISTDFAHVEFRRLSVIDIDHGLQPMADERDEVHAVWASDEPIADPAFYPALKPAEAASDVVTVLLSGTGADELFGGYGHHRLSRKMRAVSRTPSPLRSLVSSAAMGHGYDDDHIEALFRYRTDRSAWHGLAMSQYLPGDFVESLTGSRQSMLARWPLVNALLNLQIWHRLFVLEQATPPPTSSLAELFHLPTIGPIS